MTTPTTQQTNGGGLTAPVFARLDRASLLALALLFLLTIFRLVYGATHGLAEDEAYYWQWSRHPQLSYYDQGPGIAYLIRLSTLIAGNTELGVRLGGILLAAATGWFGFLTARRWFGERIALGALGLMSVIPLFAVGSVIITYDTPQMFFWAAACYAFTRTVQEERAGGWYLLGLLVGVGALCKMTMFLFAPSALVFLLLSPRHRRWLATPHPYAGFLIAALLFTPVVYWNAQNEWLGFIHLAAVGNRSKSNQALRGFGDFLGGQALILTPLLFFAFIGAIRAAVRTIKAGRETPEEIDGLRFALSFALTTLAVCTLQSLRSRLEVNWPAPAHLTGLIVIAWWFARVRGGSAAAKIAVTASVLLAAAATAVAFFPQVLPMVGVRLPAKTAVKINQIYGWPEIASQVQAARARLAAEGKPVFVAGINYRVDSVLAFYLPDQPQTKGLYLSSRRDQYYTWTDPKTLVGQNAVIALDDENDEAIALARRYFASVEPQPPIVVTREGFVGPVKIWYVYLCRDFAGYDPDRHATGY